MINFLASIEDLLPLGLDARFFRRSQRGILELADEILRRSGEASGSALALELIEEYRTLNREKRAVASSFRCVLSYQLEIVFPRDRNSSFSWIRRNSSYTFLLFFW